MIITGGYAPSTKQRVQSTEYNEAGFVRDLPDLRQSRETHGCGYYTNSDGIKVIHFM